MLSWLLETVAMASRGGLGAVRAADSREPGPLRAGKGRDQDPAFSRGAVGVRHEGGPQRLLRHELEQSQPVPIELAAEDHFPAGLGEPAEAGERAHDENVGFGAQVGIDTPAPRSNLLLQSVKLLLRKPALSGVN